MKKIAPGCELRLACLNGHALDESKLYVSQHDAPGCPSCGGLGRRWMWFPIPWYRRLAAHFRRRKVRPSDAVVYLSKAGPIEYSSDNPGPRYLSADYGFPSTVITEFSPDEVEQMLLRAKKNKWRFDQI